LMIVDVRIVVLDVASALILTIVTLIAERFFRPVVVVEVLPMVRKAIEIPFVMYHAYLTRVVRFWYLNLVPKACPGVDLKRLLVFMFVFREAISRKEYFEELV
jgi:hypothetical protein